MENRSATALSIIDPTKVAVSVTRETTLRERHEVVVNTDGRIDIDPWKGNDAPVYARLSYNDLALFLSIANSLGSWAQDMDAQGTRSVPEFQGAAPSSNQRSPETIRRGQQAKRAAKRQERITYEQRLARLQLIEANRPLCLRVLADCNNRYEEAAFVLCCLRLQRERGGRPVSLVNGAEEESLAPSHPGVLGLMTSPSSAFLPGQDFTLLQGSLGLPKSIMTQARLRPAIDPTTLLRLGAGSSQFSERYAALERSLELRKRQRAQLVSQLEDARITAASLDAGEDVVRESQKTPPEGDGLAFGKAGEGRYDAHGTADDDTVWDTAALDAEAAAAGAVGAAEVAAHAYEEAAALPDDKQAVRAERASRAEEQATQAIRAATNREREVEEQRALIMQLETRLAECDEAIARMSSQFAVVEREAAQLLASLEQPSQSEPEQVAYKDMLSRLAALGFSEHDSQIALQAMHGDFDASAEWLFNNAPRMRSQVPLNASRVDRLAPSSAAPQHKSRPRSSSATARSASAPVTALTLDSQPQLSTTTFIPQGDDEAWEDAEEALHTPPDRHASSPAESGRGTKPASALRVFDRRVRSVAAGSRPLQRLGSLDKRLFDRRAHGLGSKEEYLPGATGRLALSRATSPKLEDMADGRSVASAPAAEVGAAHDSEAGEGAWSQQTPNAATTDETAGTVPLSPISSDGVVVGVNGTPRPKTTAQADKIRQVAKFVIVSSAVALCIIDDCQGRDVPLMEMKGHNLMLQARLFTLPDFTEFKVEGSGDIQVDYYNTALSVWEPLLERFFATLNGTYKSESTDNAPKFEIDLFADDRLEFTVTPSLARNFLSAARR
jgi:hypothetical protein